MLNQAKHSLPPLKGSAGKIKVASDRGCAKNADTDFYEEIFPFCFSERADAGFARSG